VCADMQEDQHGRFVAELDRLYDSNASLLEIGSVMASDYPSALEKLNLLVQVAQEDHEALAGVAGGTGKSSKGLAKPAEVTAGIVGALAVAGFAAVRFGRAHDAAEARAAAARERAQAGETIEDQAERIVPANGGNADNGAGGDGELNIAKDEPKFLSHQEFTSSEFKQFEDNKDFDNINERKLVREGSSEIDEFNGSFDKSDSDLFGELNDNIGAADKEERLLDRLLDPNMSFDKGFEEKVSSEAKGGLKQGEIEAEQEVREDTRLIEKEVTADVDAMAQQEIETIEAIEEIGE